MDISHRYCVQMNYALSPDAKLQVDYVIDGVSVRVGSKLGRGRYVANLFYSSDNLFY